MNYYTLTSHGKPTREYHVGKWNRWFESADRRVAVDTIGESRISTVFLGIDHSFHGGPPILWETMIFGGPLDCEQDRCSGSRQDALAMHARMIDTLNLALRHQNHDQTRPPAPAPDLSSAG
jgi:hypothetical protein